MGLGWVRTGAGRVVAGVVLLVNVAQVASPSPCRVVAVAGVVQAARGEVGEARGAAAYLCLRGEVTPPDPRAPPRE